MLQNVQWMRFDAGHTKIGILGGDIENRTPAISVLSAVSRALEHGILCLSRKTATKKHDFPMTAHIAVWRRLIARYPDITAVFAMSGCHGDRCNPCTQGFRITVYRRISVIGFDGTALAEYYNPKLATIKQAYRTLAIRSVGICLDRLSYKRTQIHEIVPFELASGESIQKSGNIYR